MKLSIPFKKKSKKVEKTTRAIVIDNIISITIALIIALIIRSFFVQSFYIPSGSMKPNLLEGDYVFVTKYNYGYSKHSLPFSLPILPDRLMYSQPVRGDVVVFKFPGDNSTDYVKRLIGLPNDTIQVINSVVYINGTPLKREYVKTEIIDGITFNVYREYMEHKSYLIWQIKNYYSYGSQFFGPITLKTGEFFMMGDNRDMSKDSRFSEVGAIPRVNLVGKGGIIFFSIDGSFLEFWKWFSDIRWNRIFNLIR